MMTARSATTGNIEEAKNGMTVTYTTVQEHTGYEAVEPT